MKVHDITNGSPGPITGRASDRKSTEIRQGSGEFDKSLSRERSDRMGEKIALLLSDIEDQGKRMVDSLNLKELFIYKTKVKAFIEEAVTEMYRPAKESSMDKRGRHKIYSLIKRINKGLEGLTEDMVGGQRDRLKILEKVDSIRGLLVDLYT